MAADRLGISREKSAQKIERGTLWTSLQMNLQLTLPQKLTHAKRDLPSSQICAPHHAGENQNDLRNHPD